MAKVKSHLRIKRQNKQTLSQGPGPGENYYQYIERLNKEIREIQGDIPVAVTGKPLFPEFICPTCGKGAAAHGIPSVKGSKP